MTLVNPSTDYELGCFVIEVENRLTDKFRCIRENLPDNYGDTKSWGLLSKLRRREFLSYTLLYVNGELWSGSGVVHAWFPREDSIVHQVGWRMFLNSNARSLYVPPYTITEVLPQQVSNARELTSTVIMTFNTYNRHLFLVMRKRLESAKAGELRGKFVALPNTEIVNNVDQFVLMYKP